MPRNRVESNRSLPANPSPNTRLFLRRLERAGVDSVQKLSESDWETIQRFEAFETAPLVIKNKRVCQ